MTDHLPNVIFGLVIEIKLKIKKKKKKKKKKKNEFVNDNVRYMFFLLKLLYN